MYQDFQLIAYQTPTAEAGLGPLIDLEEHKALIGDLKKNNEWLPEIQNADMKKRLARLIGVIERAYAHQGQEVSADQSVLKVFLVPEFYFRPVAQGVQRSYTKAERDALVTLLDKYVKAKRFEHWFFVLGTVIWEAPINVILNVAALPEAVVVDAEKAKELVVKNTALVGQGGNKLTTFDKAEYSPADNIVDAYWAAYTQKKVTALDKAIDIVLDEAVLKKHSERKAVEKQMVEAIKKYLGQGIDNKLNGIVTFGGKNFGIEVCLDHEMRFLSEALNSYRKVNDKKDFQLDAQILICCGMPVNSNRVSVPVGRVLLRNDGGHSFDETPPVNVEICRLLSGGKDKPVVAGYPAPDQAGQYVKDNKSAYKEDDLKDYLTPMADTKYDQLKHGTADANGKKLTIDEALPQKLLIFERVPIDSLAQNQNQNQ